MAALCEWCVIRRIHKDLAYTIHYEPEDEAEAEAEAEAKAKAKPETRARAQARPRVRIFKQLSHKNNVAIYTLQGKWATSFHDQLDTLLNLPQNIAVENAHAHAASNPQPQTPSETECSVQHPSPISGA